MVFSATTYLPTQLHCLVSMLSNSCFLNPLTFDVMGSVAKKSLRFGVIAFVLSYIFVISSCESQHQGQSAVIAEQTGLIRQVTQQSNSFDVPEKFKISNGLSIFGDQWSILRDQAPSSYIFKINSLTSLMNTGRDLFQSGVFEAGGYKWRMVFYPKGDKKAGSYVYVSMYVALVDAKSVSGDVYAEVKLFAYNQKKNKYMMVQDAPMTRFNAANPVGGSPKFMPQSTFSGWFNEYLIDDNCILGAEIHVYSQPAKQQEALSFLKISTDEGTFNWKIKGFDANRDLYTSGEFVVGGRTWKLWVYPKGNGEEEGKSLSGFLHLADYKTLQPGDEVYVRGKLRVFSPNSRRTVEKTFYNWLNPTVNNWGFRGLLPLKDLNQYIVDGSLKVGVVIEQMSQAKFSA